MAVPFCDSPENIVFNYTGGVLNISWTGTSTLYKIRYRIAQDAWINLPIVGSPAVSTAAVIPGQNYQFEISSMCDDDPLLTVYADYTIPSTLPGPDNLAIVAKTETTVTISWTGPVVDYVVSWVSEDDLGDEDYEIVNGNEFTVQNLEPGKIYKIFVTRYDNAFPIPAPNNAYIDKDNCCFVGTQASTTIPPGP